MKIGFLDGVHPLLEPFAGSRQEAVVAIEQSVHRRFRSTGPLVRAWPGRTPDDLCVLFAWFQTLRDLVRSEDAFVTKRGLELLEESLDAPTRGRDASIGALALAVPPRLDEYEIPLLALRSLVEAARHGSSVGAFTSRTELLEHATQLTYPEVVTYLHVLGHTDDRSLLEAKSLGQGVQLVRWLATLRPEFAHGRLRVATEDVARFQVDLASLERGDDTPEGRRLLRSHAEWAGGFLLKGWPLTHTLGFARGRVLAGLLRFSVAELAALEERHFAPGDPPPAGWTRVAACFAAAVLTRAPARW